ncbi:MAG: copper resistance protein CopC [Chloroflexi bacterium]|nr:copper resistance protein CopC [Chloroflexota bacterium]
MTTRRPARLLAVFAFVTLVVVGAPAAVLGHAELETVFPADRSTIVESPAEIVMTFTQDLDPGKSSIRVADAGGTVVAEGGAVNARESLRTMRLELATPLSAGTYTVRWTSFSTEDNEQARGTTTFTLTAASPPPTVAPIAPPSVAQPARPTPAPSVLPSIAPSPTTPAASTTDALISIVVVILAVLGLGLWLLRGRSRRAT